jgi:hypothetical protein
MTEGILQTPNVAEPQLAWVGDLWECANRLDRLASMRKQLWNCRRKHKVR